MHPESAANFAAKLSIGSMLQATSSKPAFALHDSRYRFSPLLLGPILAGTVSGPPLELIQ